MKTKETDSDVSTYLANLKNLQRRSDSEVLVRIMEKASGQKAVMISCPSSGSTNRERAGAYTSTSWMILNLKF